MSRLDVILVDLDSLVTVSVTLWYVVHGSLAGRGGGGNAHIPTPH